MILKYFLSLSVVFSFAICDTIPSDSNLQKIPEKIDLVISEYEQHRVFNLCEGKVLSLLKTEVIVQCKEDNAILHYKNLEMINPVVQLNSIIKKDFPIGRAQLDYTKSM
jgi:hypothetical protein